jgi:hypothetical protein
MLQRYRCLGIDGMDKDHQGDWVRYEDYLSLLQKLDDIRITLLQLKRAEEQKS